MPSPFELADQGATFTFTADRAIEIVGETFPIRLEGAQVADLASWAAQCRDEMLGAPSLLQIATGEPSLPSDQPTPMGG